MVGAAGDQARQGHSVYRLQKVEHDDETGKTVGWEPVEQSSFAKYHAEAITAQSEAHPTAHADELVPRHL